MIQNVAIDNNIFRYFLEAIEPKLINHSEDDNKKDPQRLAMLRCFLYSPPYYVPPSVETEYLKTKKMDLKDFFISSHQVLLLDINPPPCVDKINELKKIYMEKHHKEMDCQILSEAEAGDFSTFLTFDEDFYKRLKDSTIKIMYPTEYLETLNIQKGTAPMLTPAQSNPLFNKQNWWRI